MAVSKSFIFSQSRGSSVVEQPIRNRQVASSTLALGSNSSEDNKRKDRELLLLGIASKSNLVRLFV
jgi:hypothetical protein